MKRTKKELDDKKKIYISINSEDKEKSNVPTNLKHKKNQETNQTEEQNSYINEASKNILIIQNENRNLQNCFAHGKYSFSDAPCQKRKKRKYQNKEKEKGKWNYYMRITKDLYKSILIPRITAFCMSLIDNLNEQEQMLAKMCSLFNDTFNLIKMKNIYPIYITKHELKKIVVSLVEKNVFSISKNGKERNEKNKNKKDIPKENVNSIHNINFIYKDLYNKMNLRNERKKKYQNIFSNSKNTKHMANSDNDVFFYIKNHSLKKVLCDLLENEEKTYLKKIHKRFIDT